MALFDTPDYKREKESILNEQVVRYIQGYFGPDRDEMFERCFELADKAYDLFEKDKNLCCNCMKAQYEELFALLGLDYNKEVDYVNRKCRHSSTAEGFFWKICYGLAYSADENRDKKIEPRYSADDIESSISNAAKALFEEVKLYWAKNGLDASNLTLKTTEIREGNDKCYKPYDFVNFNMYVHFDDKTTTADKQYCILKNIFENYGIHIRGYVGSDWLGNKPEKTILVEALAKDVRERGLAHELTASLKECTINPWKISFEEDDILKIREYSDLFGSKEQLWVRVYGIFNSIEKDPEIIRCPKEWFENAKDEFRHLVNDDGLGYNINTGLKL